MLPSRRVELVTRTSQVAGGFGSNPIPIPFTYFLAVLFRRGERKKTTSKQNTTKLGDLQGERAEPNS